MTFNGTTGGTVQFSYDGQPAADSVTFIPTVSPTATQLQNHINTIPAFSGNIVVSATANPNVFNIDFQNFLAGQDVAQIGSSIAGTATTATPVPGGIVSERQTITVTGTGTTQFSFNGVTATGITTLTLGNTAENLAAIQTSLNSIAALNGKVVVINSPGNNNAGGGPFTVIFTGPRAPRPRR